MKTEETNKDLERKMFLVIFAFLLLVFLHPPRNVDRHEPAPGVLPRARSTRLRRLAVEEEEGEPLHRPEVAALLVCPQGAFPLLVHQPTGGNNTMRVVHLSTTK